MEGGVPRSEADVLVVLGVSAEVDVVKTQMHICN